MSELELLKHKVETLESMLIQKSKDYTQLVDVKSNYEKTLKITQLLLEVYRLNSQYENIHTNIDLSLTHVAGALAADTAFVIKKEKNETRIIDSSFQYYNTGDDNRNETFKHFSEEFHFEKSFPLIMQELDYSDINDIKLIDIENAHQKDETCRKYNIKRLTFVPIIIDNKVSYYLGVANASLIANIELLKYLSPAYSDSLKRILQEKLIQKMAVTDNFTGLYDRGYFNKITTELEEQQDKTVGYIIIDLFRLKHVNDNHGHETGDKYIVGIAQVLQKVFGEDNMVFRIGGDEFGIICIDKTKDYIDLKLTELNELIAKTPIIDRNGNAITARVDCGYDIAKGKINFQELAHNADLKMNANKQQYYKQHNLERRK